MDANVDDAFGSNAGANVDYVWIGVNHEIVLVGQKEIQIGQDLPYPQ